MEELLVADPFLLLDQLGMHDRDLPARSAEGYEAELQPKSKGFAKRRYRTSILSGGTCHNHVNWMGVFDSFDSDQVYAAKRFFIFERELRLVGQKINKHENNQTNYGDRGERCTGIRR
jgi:hypothetical protein